MPLPRPETTPPVTTCEGGRGPEAGQEGGRRRGGRSAAHRPPAGREEEGASTHQVLHPLLVAVLRHGAHPPPARVTRPRTRPALSTCRPRQRPHTPGLSAIQTRSPTNAWRQLGDVLEIDCPPPGPGPAGSRPCERGGAAAQAAGVERGARAPASRPPGAAEQRSPPPGTKGQRVSPRPRILEPVAETAMRIDGVQRCHGGWASGTQITGRSRAVRLAGGDRDKDIDRSRWEHWEVGRSRGRSVGRSVSPLRARGRRRRGSWT